MHVREADHAHPIRLPASITHGRTPRQRPILSKYSPPRQWPSQIDAISAQIDCGLALTKTIIDSDDRQSKF
jgi:hypothetical protein